ncbi:MAG: RcnB family protein [Hyphomonas sp.]|nr:RcnB family protein [Hyphomonas sp.]MCB9969994.1 RcnB family protein [Hyphomonas sp.]
MNVKSTVSKLLAALAVGGLVLAPIASADPPNRGHDRDRGSWNGGDRGDYRGDRGHDRGGTWNGYSRDRSAYRGGDYNGRRDAYRYDQRRTYSYRAPPARYYAPPPPRVNYSYRSYGYNYGPYYRSGYVSPYQIGGYYRPHRSTVYINDYGYYGLYAPPAGYYWVHDYDSGDAILASVATGAIIGLVIGALAYN